MPLQKFEWPLNAKALSNHIFKATNLTYVFAISIVFIDRKVLCLFFFFVQHPQMTIRSFFYWVNWMRRCLRRISNSNEITKQYEPFEIVCRSWNIYIHKKKIETLIWFIPVFYCWSRVKPLNVLWNSVAHERISR